MDAVEKAAAVILGDKDRVSSIKKTDIAGRKNMLCVKKGGIIYILITFKGPMTLLQPNVMLSVFRVQLSSVKFLTN